MKIAIARADYLYPNCDQNFTASCYQRYLRVQLQWDYRLYENCYSLAR